MPEAGELITVADDPERNRYEIRVDGELAGYVTYRASADTYAFPHAEVEPRFGGRGLATTLVSFALDDMEQRGMAVLPQCPFVLKVVADEPRYLALVPVADRARFGLPEVG